MKKPVIGKNTPKNDSIYSRGVLYDFEGYYQSDTGHHNRQGVRGVLCSV